MENQYISQIIETGKRMYERGYNVSIDGNISIRLGPNEILMTRSGARLGELKPTDILVVDLEGNRQRGEGTPSSERNLHLQIYKVRPEVNAVIHAHAPNCIALSLSDIDTLNLTYIALAPIPITEFAMPSSPESFEKLKPFVMDYNWAILRRHGIVTYEQNIEAAFLRLEGMEHGAKILLAARVAGPLTPVDAITRERLLQTWK